MRDLRARTVGAPQVTTDGFPAYPDAVSAAFGRDVRYGRYIGHGSWDGVAPALVYLRRQALIGTPSASHMTTSLFERQNLTIRSDVGRMGRRTNAYSKRMLHHIYAEALFFFYYNFVKPHRTLTEKNGGYATTPAMAAGLADSPYSMEWLSDQVSAAYPVSQRPRRYMTRRRRAHLEQVNAQYAVEGAW